MLEAKNIDVRPFTCTNLAEETISSVSDLRLLNSSSAPDNQLVLFAATPGKITSKKNRVSSDRSPLTQKNAHLFDRVELKLPPSFKVGEKTSFSRSKSPSVAVSTSAQHPQRAVLLNVHFCEAHKEKVLLIIGGTS